MQGERYVEVVKAGLWVPRAADIFDSVIREAVNVRGRAVLAVSDSSSTAAVFQELAMRDLPWSEVVLVPVDLPLRGGRPGHSNFPLRAKILSHLDVQWLDLPSEEPLDEGISHFMEQLQAITGEPPVFDVVQLGLGSDGHTAGLIAGDPILAVEDRDVAVTSRPFRGSRRVSLTRPIIDRARLVVWLVHGASRAEALDGLRQGDTRIPAGLLNPAQSIVLTDEDAGL